jgi:hypothetical protein
MDDDTVKTFKHQIGERVYYFMCDKASPLGEVKDSLCHFIAHMVNFESQVIAEMQKQQQEQVPKEQAE